MSIRVGRSWCLAGATLLASALAITCADSGSRESWPTYQTDETNFLVDVAQNYGRPPGDVVGDPVHGAPRTDEAGLLVRIDRLESQVRQLTGQIEQMQFTNRKLEEQLKKFQDDVEFRFQESGNHVGPPTPTPPPPKSLQRRSELEAPSEVASFGDAPVRGIETPAAGSLARRPLRRNDAFDPESDPTAPGAPRPLGSIASAQPGMPLSRMPQSARAASPLDGGDADAPLELSGGKLRAAKDASAHTPPEPSGPTPASASAPSATRPLGPATTEAAAMPIRPSPDPAREAFDLALGLLKQKEYEAAEKSFTAFLQKSPKSKLAPEAIYYLGETYFQRGRQREAAEQYLKISTAYVSSARAPDAFLRLGQSLNALGAKEQACAAYAELERKYPNASATVKASVEREVKRARC
jgi:tol-pal system protein YbgF